MTTTTRTREDGRTVVEFVIELGDCLDADEVARAMADARSAPTVTPPPDAPATSPPTARPPADEPQGTHAWLLDFAGCASDLPADYATQHDHYIRGTPRR